MRDEALSIMLSELQNQLSERKSMHSPSERSSISPLENDSCTEEFNESWKFCEGVLDHSLDKSAEEEDFGHVSGSTFEGDADAPLENSKLKKTWSILPKPAEDVYLSNLPTWPRRHYKELGKY